MKIKYLLAASLVLVICITGALTGCSSANEGSFPKFAIGDTWVSKWVTGGQEYTVTNQVTGDEFYQGLSCWIMEMTFDPAYQSAITGTTSRYNKASLDVVSTEYHYNVPGESTTIAFQVTGTPYYPLKVGKVSKETEYQTITTVQDVVTQTENVTVTYTTRVEKIEKITVPAGTFKCFKILKYDESGTLIQTTWRSDKTKLFQVKMEDPAEEGSSYELISYTMK